MGSTTPTNKPHCRACKGTRWTDRGLCHHCETILERARSGKIAVEDAHAELDKLSTPPKCFVPRAGLNLELKAALAKVQAEYMRRLAS